MKDLAKGFPRWVRGVFVAKSEGPDEFIGLTPAGTQIFRTNGGTKALRKQESNLETKLRGGSLSARTSYRKVD